MNKHTHHFNFNIITEPFSNLDCCDPFCLPEEPNKFSKKLLELEERINNLVFEKGAEYEAGQGVRFTVDNDKKVINVLINEELLEFKDNKIDLKIEELKKIFGESGGVVATSEWGKITGDINKQQDLHKLLNSKATTTQLDDVSAEVTQLDKKIGNITNTVSNLNTSVSSLLDEVNEHKTSIKSLETFKTDTAKSLNTLLGKLESLESTVEDLDLETINQTVEALQSTVAVFNSKLEKHTTDIAELNTKISTHESEVDDKFSAINTSLDSMIHDITQVYNIVESLDLEAINNTVKNMETQIQAINETVSAQNVKISTVENTVNEAVQNMGTQVVTINDKVDAQVGKISTLESKVARNTSDISELKDKVAGAVDLQDTVAGHTTDIAALNATVNQVASGLTALSKLIEGLDVDTIALTLQELQSQVQENNSKIESIVKNDIAQINDDISTLTTKINENKIVAGEGLIKTGDVVSINYNTSDFKIINNMLILRPATAVDETFNLFNPMLIDFFALAYEKFLISKGTLNSTIESLNNFLIEAGFKFSRPYSTDKIDGFTSDLQLFLDIANQFSPTNTLGQFRGYLSRTSDELIELFFGRKNKFNTLLLNIELLPPLIWCKYFDRIRMNKTYYIELGLDESLFE